MKIVVVGGESGVCERSLGVLRECGNTIDVLDQARAEVALRTRPPEVLIVWLPIGIGELRSLCGADTSHSTYVIAVVPEDLPPRAISSAVAAGCHDVLHAPFTDEELCARVEVVERLRGLHLAAKPPQPRTIENARAWHFLGDVVANDLEQMVGQKVRVSRRASIESPAVRIASIPMVLATVGLELSIALVADRETCRWLGDNLLCESEPTTEMLDDVLREMANVAGGAVKRAMLPEGLVLSTGIPVGGDPGVMPANHTRQAWQVVLGEGVSLAVIAEIRARPNRRVPARGLIEGMVLVDDVKNAAGLLLLPAGTRLTETTAERLRRLDIGLVAISSAA